MISGCTQLTAIQQSTLDWCVAGEKWIVDSREVGDVVGAIMYKGQTRCHVRQTMDMDGGEVTTNFYILDEESNDFWMEMTHPNIRAMTGKDTVAARIVNKVECVEGDCELMEARVTAAAPSGI
jgi:hypothetical protein